MIIVNHSPLFDGYLILIVQLVPVTGAVGHCLRLADWLSKLVSWEKIPDLYLIRKVLSYWRSWPLSEAGRLAE